MRSVLTRLAVCGMLAAAVLTASSQKAGASSPPQPPPAPAKGALSAPAAPATPAAAHEARAAEAPAPQASGAVAPAWNRGCAEVQQLGAKQFLERVVASAATRVEVSGL